MMAGKSHRWKLVKHIPGTCTLKEQQRLHLFVGHEHVKGSFSSMLAALWGAQPGTTPTILPLQFLLDTESFDGLLAPQAQN